jgi:hypothetical protein
MTRACIVNNPTKTVAKNNAAPQIWFDGYFLFEVDVRSHTFQSAELANCSRKLPRFPKIPVRSLPSRRFSGHHERARRPVWILSDR